MFFFIQSSYDTNIHKPNPEVFAPALGKLQSKHITLKEVIYIGDALDDYTAATSAGLHFCAIANHTIKEKVFIEKGIPYIKDVSQLPEFIKGI